MESAQQKQYVFNIPASSGDLVERHDKQGNLPSLNRIIPKNISRTTDYSSEHLVQFSSFLWQPFELSHPPPL